MTLAVTNRMKIRYIAETVFGDTPTVGNPNDLRFTGQSLKFNLGTDTSKEIRDDRQTSDLTLVSASANGGVDFELSYKEYDILFAALFQNAFSAFGTNGVGANIPTSATFASNSLTAGAATSGPSLFTNLKPGQWVGISGSTIQGQNIWAQVSRTVAPTATVLTFEGTPFAGVTGNGGTAVKITSSLLENGVTQNSFTFERQHADIGQFFAFRGLTVGSMSMNIASGSFVTGSFTFEGKDGLVNASTTLPGTAIVSQTYGVINGVSGVGTILENGVPLTGESRIKSITWNFDNKLRSRDAAGVLGSIGIASGSIAVSGTIEVYLRDATLYEKFVNNTASSLYIPVKDNAGNGYVVGFPRIKYGDANITAGGLDADCMISLPFTALVDPVTQSTVQLSRIGV